MTRVFLKDQSLEDGPTDLPRETLWLTEKVGVLHRSSNLVNQRQEAWTVATNEAWVKTAL